MEENTPQAQMDIQNKMIDRDHLRVPPTPLEQIQALTSRYERGDLGPDGFAKAVQKVLEESES